MEQMARTDRQQTDLDRQLAIVAGMDVLRRPYVTAAYATGSLVAGFGTPTSDVDVIVLVDKDADKDTAKRDGAIRRHESVRADFEVFTLDEFSAMVAACADFRAAWDSGRIHRLAQPVRLLSQFIAGVRVLKPSAELAALSARISEQRDALIRLSVGRASMYGNNTHEDVLGLIEVSDEIGVLRRSHDYLRFGMDAWCTARGSVYPDDRFKWLWHRLTDLLRDAGELALLRSLYVPELVTEPAPDTASLRVDVTQALLAQALLAAWAPNPGCYRVPVLPCWPSAGQHPLWRSPDWMVIRTPTAWGLGAGFNFYKMPVQAVIAWACASGRDRCQVAAMVIEQSTAAFGVKTGLAAAESLIDRLVARGAILDAHPSREHQS
jgi:Nucleotidyltransferase domain